MVDIHCHLLPGVDDGAPSVEVSLAMLRRGWEEGTEAAVLTPHLRPGHGPQQAGLHQQRFAQLQEAARRAGLPVALHLGAEIEFRFGLATAARWPGVALAGGRHVLVDLPSGPLSPALAQGFFELRAAGFRPILAHPERSRGLAGSPQLLQQLRDQEVLCQVDGGSLTGRFGRRARSAAEDLVRRGWVEFAASDAHDLEHRPFTLRRARARVAELAGPEEAERLFAANPRRLVEGNEIVRRQNGPAPQGLWSRWLRRRNEIGESVVPLWPLE